MTRLKDEVIEDTSKLGEIIEYCKLEIEAYNKCKDDILNSSSLHDHGVLIGRKELADAVLKILGLLEE